MDQIRVAVIRGELGTIQQLHASGVDVFQRTSNGFTPLHLAASAGHGSLVGWYRDHGCSLNTTASGAVTPFISSIQSHHVTTTELLIELGYRIRMESRCNPPMSYAVSSDNPLALELIAMYHPEGLERPYEQPNHRGVQAFERTPMWWALHGHRFNCSMTLLALRVDIPNLDGIPPERAELLKRNLSIDFVMDTRFRVYFSLSLLRKLLYEID